MPWRIYAAFVVVLLLVVVQRRPLMPGAGLNWEGAKALYWSFGVLGLVGFAYGFRILSQKFWRAYALIFAVDITIRSMAKFGWVPVARLFGLSEGSRHGTLTILVGLGFIAAACVALLRYGGWLKGPAPAPAIVERESSVKSLPPVERVSAGDQPSARYSLVQCALASLAGAIVNAVLFRLYAGQWAFGNWGLGFATLEFIIAFLVLICGGRWLVNRLAAAGKDSVVRGAAIGASLGALVGALIALMVTGALVGGPLFASATGVLLVALLGAPFGVVNGAVVGCALMLLGQQKSARAS